MPRTHITKMGKRSNWFPVWIPIALIQTCDGARGSAARLASVHTRPNTRLGAHTRSANTPGQADSATPHAALRD